MEISLDYNLIHIDREFAQANGLPDIILQGMCTMGLTAKHIIENDQYDWKKMINNFGLHHLRELLISLEKYFESEELDTYLFLSSFTLDKYKKPKFHTEKQN